MQWIQLYNTYSIRLMAQKKNLCNLATLNISEPRLAIVGGIFWHFGICIYLLSCRELDGKTDTTLISVLKFEYKSQQPRPDGSQGHSALFISFDFCDDLMSDVLINDLQRCFCGWFSTVLAASSFFQSFFFLFSFSSRAKLTGCGLRLQI